MNRENRVALIGSLITSLSLLCFLVIFNVSMSINKLYTLISFFTDFWVNLVVTLIIVTSVSFLLIKKAFAHFKKLKNLPLFIYGALYGLVAGTLVSFLLTIFHVFVINSYSDLFSLAIGEIICAIYGLILAPIVRWLANKN